MTRFAYSLTFVVVLILTLGLCLSRGGLAWAIPDSQYVCRNLIENNTTTMFQVVDPDLFVDVNNGFFRRNCIVTLSAEFHTESTNLRVGYSIDGGSCVAPTTGPKAIIEPAISAHTIVTVIELGRGLHSIQPCLRSAADGELVQIFDPCLIAECWTK
jgi:hypothetical protein